MPALVSVLIPAHNCERWIAETIQSALSQTWPRVEVIVVDDGSTDGTLQVAKRFGCSRLKIVHRENGGASSARNAALRICQGDYIQWLDSDDLLAPDKIERQMASAAGGGPGILYASAWGKFYYRTRRAAFDPSPLWQDLHPVDWLSHHIGGLWWMPPVVWLVSRDLAERAGPWDERLTLDDDGEYCCRLVSNSRLVRFVAGARSYYRMANQSSLSRSWSRHAWESLVLSADLKIRHLLLVEDNERTRASCNRGLSWSANYLDPVAPDLAASIRRRIEELGGTAAPKAVSRKYRFAQTFVGEEGATRLKLSFWRKQRYAICQWDRLLAALGKIRG